MQKFYTLTYEHIEYTIVVDNCMPYIPLKRFLKRFGAGNTEAIADTCACAKTFTLSNGSEVLYISLADLHLLKGVVNSAKQALFLEAIYDLLAKQGGIFYLGKRISPSGTILNYYSTQYGHIALLNYSGYTLVSLKPIADYFGCNNVTLSKHIRGSGVRKSFAPAFGAPFRRGGAVCYVNINVLCRLACELNWNIDRAFLNELKEITTPVVQNKSDSVGLDYTELAFKLFDGTFIPVLRDSKGAWCISLTALYEKLGYKNVSKTIQHHYGTSLPSTYIYSPIKGNRELHYFAYPKDLHPISTEMSKEYPKDILDWFKTFWDVAPDNHIDKTVKMDKGSAQSLNVSTANINISELANAIIEEIANRFRQ